MHALPTLPYRKDLSGNLEQPNTRGSPPLPDGEGWGTPTELKMGNC